MFSNNQRIKYFAKESKWLLFSQRIRLCESQVTPFHATDTFVRVPSYAIPFLKKCRRFSSDFKITTRDNEEERSVRTL